MQGKPLSEYQQGVIRRMVRHGCMEIHRMADRAECDGVTVRAFILRELRERYAAEHRHAQLDDLADREGNPH